MKIAVEPTNWRQQHLQAAVVSSGGEIAAVSEATALVWGDSKCGELQSILHDELEWVQLPWAGIEPFVNVLDDRRRWTCGKRIYAEPVAEHVLALMLAGLHNLAEYARARQWSAAVGASLHRRKVLIIGAGGITDQLLPLLTPFNCHTTVVRRNPSAAVTGANRCVGPEQLHAELPQADIVVLALALTPQNQGLISATELQLMKKSAWLINVARGAHIVTDDLVDALAAKHIAGAALDVTDPEPLPNGHPLWALPNCLITPHTANTPEMGIALLAAHVAENTRRYIAGQELLAPVDVSAGY